MYCIHPSTVTTTMGPLEHSIVLMCRLNALSASRPTWNISRATPARPSSLPPRLDMPERGEGVLPVAQTPIVLRPPRPLPLTTLFTSTTLPSSTRPAAGTMRLFTTIPAPCRGWRLCPILLSPVTFSKRMAQCSCLLSQVSFTIPQYVLLLCAIMPLAMSAWLAPSVPILEHSVPGDGVGSVWQKPASASMKSSRPAFAARVRGCSMKLGSFRLDQLSLIGTLLFATPPVVKAQRIDQQWR
mmetsp:Transcript_28754/g.63292  ORF Transcript_28754/g.63292 Transcript_28754/m.63292 type:complete len:241 (+) Transcript_28754:998-1720(+)